MKSRKCLVQPLILSTELEDLLLLLASLNTLGAWNEAFGERLQGRLLKVLSRDSDDPNESEDV